MNGLLLVYPFIVHAALVMDSRWLEFAALAVLAGHVLGPRLLRAQLWAWCVFGLALIASAGLVFVGDGRLLLYAESVLAPLVLMWFFARTLLPGQEPMVTRFALALFGTLSLPLRRYTRQVTWFWVVTLGVFALTNLALALWASPLVWSLFSNFIIYPLIGVLFVAEWLFRRWYLRGYERLTWREYLHNMIKLDFRQLLA